MSKTDAEQRLTRQMTSIKPFLCKGMPEWMREGVLSNIKEYDPNFGGSRDSSNVRADCGGATLSNMPPHYEGDAIPVERISAMNASNFYFRFARHGLPTGCQKQPPSYAKQVLDTKPKRQLPHGVSKSMDGLVLAFSLYSHTLAHPTHSAFSASLLHTAYS